ncbi:hypothetical protein [Pseudomonas sp. FME51]|uniref:hypothetical protein n=1 Tax=Pseudomonas sp. FME51 TaxID=2742609 RepID=UPI001866FC9E|nr:hypothetical protein [Pseudomonas sp. FME51]
MVTLQIPDSLVLDARLYSCAQDDSDAVCRVLSDYGRLVAEVRQLRRRVAQIDEEGLMLDQRLQRLQDACRAILDL